MNLLSNAVEIIILRHEVARRINTSVQTLYFVVSQLLQNQLNPQT